MVKESTCLHPRKPPRGIKILNVRTATSYVQHGTDGEGPGELTSYKTYSRIVAHILIAIARNNYSAVEGNGSIMRQVTVKPGDAQNIQPPCTSLKLD